MKRKIMQSLAIASLGFILSFSLVSASAQENTNTTKGEMKTSGSEVKNAGTTAGHDMKHGRVVSAGKHFGKHSGHAARHFAVALRRP
jgi:hypothetical protein